jgi:hypothetical protein
VEKELTDAEWDALSPEEQERLQDEFEDSHPDMNGEPFDPDQPDTGGPARPAHVR